MPKKKAPCNAFYFFMLDRKAAYERNGERFPNGLKDVCELVSLEWQHLPPSDKKKYEDQAKAEKARLKGDTSRKYTNQHNSFDYLERSKNEEEELKRRMNEDIDRTIRNLCSTGKIAEFKFYLIHINYFCISEGECYHPAELAISEFNLAEGVTDVLHIIFNCEHIPLGYRHDAMMRSDTVHRIPLEAKDGEKQLYNAWVKVKKMLEHGRSAHGGDYPPLYTLPDNVNLNTSMSCVKSLMQSMCESCDDRLEDYKVYPLDKLFLELRNSCAELNLPDDIPWPSIPFACSKLEEDIYNYTPTIACAFHLREDHVVNCSKSFVQRWAFLICDVCCPLLNIPLVPGRHVPENAAVNMKPLNQQRDLERSSEAAAKPAPRPFTMVSHVQGKPSSAKFLPVEIDHKPLPQPQVQPIHKPPASRSVPRYPDIDNSEENFPAIPVGRGRGKIPPRGGVRGTGPMSFSAAAQSRK